MAHITNTDDIIDIRDVIARVEELREELTGVKDDTSEEFAALSLTEWAAEIILSEHPFSDTIMELQELEALLAECKGNGGDEQWEGDWYPITLIRDSYFEAYAEELAEDTGAINPAATWPNNCIDWERAARELQQDYTSVEFGGETYWTR